MAIWLQARQQQQQISNTTNKLDNEPDTAQINEECNTNVEYPTARAWLLQLPSTSPATPSHTQTCIIECRQAVVLELVAIELEFTSNRIEWIGHDEEVEVEDEDGTSV
jgi:hypothetical protein